MERTESEGRIRVAAMFSGPLVGAFLAFSHNALGDVHPADVGYTYAGCVIIGGVAGFLAAIGFSVTGLLTFRDAGAKSGTSKAMDFTDAL